MAYIEWYDKYSAVQGTAGEALTEGDNIVCINSSSQLVKADANAANLKRPYGVSGGVYASGEKATGWRRCRTKGHTGLTVGGQVYLSDTAGSFSQALPADGSQVVPLGIAKAADTIEWDIPLATIQKQAAATSTGTLA